MIVTYETFEHQTGTEEIAIITYADGSYTSMLKSTWDELQAQKELGGTL